MEKDWKGRGMFRRYSSTAKQKKTLVMRVSASAFLIFVAYGLLLNYGATQYVLKEHQLILSEQHLLPTSSEETISLREAELVPKQEQDRELVPEKVRVSLLDDDKSKLFAGTYDVRNTTLCFITSIFGANVKHADSPRNVTGIFSNYTSPFDFLLFTNLEDISAPGWTKVVKTDLPYKRFITQSRWAKFMGWRDEALSHCGTIIYFDGYLRPVNNLSKFHDLAANITKSESGYAAIAHPGLKKRGMEKLLHRIVKHKKDLLVNVNATHKWLREQPDFHDKIKYYLNKYLAYDPSNQLYRKVSSFFWDHYSQEVDSWRDQPLWSYCIHHFNVTPLVFTKKGAIIFGGDYFEQNHKQMGFGGHTYTETSDNDAATAAKSR